jgi:5-methylcytosine-specific restriction endonuclease McrA
MNRKQKIRDNFREAVFKRDGHKCKRCGKPASQVKLDAHHVTDRNGMPNGGYVKENGISLCEDGKGGGCHMLAEKFHISGGKEWEPGMHPNDLYAMIGSSYDLAVKASERLK